MQDIIDTNRAEYEALPTEEKKDKFLREKSTGIAADFYADDLSAAQEHFKTLGSFERDFPSVCFALATGIGKTRLMGACIAYLRYEKGIKNFFVMAPNLTIYRKLKADLGITSNPKYVFKGLDLFVDPPRIIDGDNYNEFRQGTFGVNDVVINVFNISKLNCINRCKFTVCTDFFYHLLGILLPPHRTSRPLRDSAKSSAGWLSRQSWLFSFL